MAAEEIKNDNELSVTPVGIPVKTKPQGILKKSQIASPIIEDLRGKDSGNGQFTPKQIRAMG